MTQGFYRILLRAYPRRTRTEFGREMEGAFAALCREQQGNWRGLMAVCAGETLDALRAGLRQRRATPASGHGDPGKGSRRRKPRRRGAELPAHFSSDLRLAARALRRNPGFTALVTITLALGLGATTAMFALLDATILHPLRGVADPDSLAVLYEFTRERHSGASYPDYRDLRQVEAFSGLAASSMQTAVLSDDEQAERLSVQLVSANYFDVVGARPLLGRGFRADEEEGFGAHPVVVLSDALWTRRFAADPAVLGRRIRLSGRDFEVVGVAPRGFRGAGLDVSPDLWAPAVMIGSFASLPFGDGVLDYRGLMMFAMIGRLRPGVGLEAAQTAVDLQATAIEEAAPGMFDRPRRFLVLPAAQGAFRPAARGDMVRYTGVLLAVGGGLLLIASITVGGLLAVRAAGRRREMAVRRALGAGRGRLLQQLAIEGLLLALLGGLGGLTMAVAGLPLLEALTLPAGAAPELALDGGLLAFNFLLAGATGVLFSLAPAVHATAARGIGVARGTAPPPVRRYVPAARSLLVVVQVAVSVLLLVGAGLLARTVLNLAAVERGFDADDLLVASFDLEQAGYDEVAGRQLFDALIDRLAGIPGVRRVAVGSDVPLGGPAGGQPLLIEGRDDLEPGAVDQSLIGPGYFATLGVRLTNGRPIAARDGVQAAGVVVVNEALARLAWPGEDPLGRRVQAGTEGPVATVVGVVRDYRHAGLREDPAPHLYWPIAQQYRFGKDFGVRRLLVRTEGRPLAVSAAVRAAVRELDADLPLFALRSMGEQAAATFAEERQAATLVGAFSLLALVLSSVGLFGVLAYAVAEGRREIGVRCALGARASQVAAGVVARGVALAGVGVGLGLVAAAAGTRVLASWLFGVAAIDPQTFTAIALLVLAVAAAASFVPARRATRVDPAIALRNE